MSTTREPDLRTRLAALERSAGSGITDGRLADLVALAENYADARRSGLEATARARAASGQYTERRTVAAKEHMAEMWRRADAAMKAEWSAKDQLADAAARMFP